MRGGGSENLIPSTCPPIRPPFIRRGKLRFGYHHDGTAKSSLGSQQQQRQQQRVGKLCVLGGGGRPSAAFHGEPDERGGRAKGSDTCKNRQTGGGSGGCREEMGEGGLLGGSKLRLSQMSRIW